MMYILPAATASTFFNNARYVDRARDVARAYADVHLHAKVSQFFGTLLSQPMAYFGGSVALWHVCLEDSGMLRYVPDSQHFRVELCRHRLDDLRVFGITVDVE